MWRRSQIRQLDLVVLQDYGRLVAKESYAHGDDLLLSDGEWIRNWLY